MPAAFQGAHKIKLLLVDDDPSMVRLLAKIIDRSFGNQIEMLSLTDPARAATLSARESRMPAAVH